MVKITGVAPRSRAARRGARIGDELVSINGNEIRDVLDYRFYLAEQVVEIELLRGGKTKRIKIKKDTYDDIGLEFETPLMDKKQTCRNGCIFCFIDQNPVGMRESIYFKDDDSRLSFLHGNYITLTNMTERDVERIVKMRFSPINISVHTTNPELRVKMMKNKRAGEVLSYLDRFAEAGLSMCGQIVLCRGVNDGEELMRSMRDLERYYPNMGSVSIVPAGLTEHRDGLYPLTDFTAEEAGAVLDMIDSVAQENLQKHGSRIFFAADELYLKAGRPIPSEEYYEGYPQIENGVGMLRSMNEELTAALEEATATDASRTVSVVTGVASYDMIKGKCDEIMRKIPGLQIKVYKIVNNFFGKSITVSGLLTGKDIYEQLLDKELGDLLLVPANALRAGEEVFLCDMTVDELAERLGVRVLPTRDDGYEFVDHLLGCGEA